MKHCETCGLDFYSDVEYERHQEMERVQVAVQKTSRFWGNVETSLNTLSIYLIKQHKRCSFEEAADEFFLDRLRYNRAVYKYNKNVQEDWEKLLQEEEAKGKE